ncbi:oxygenase MpaB family protein [Streptomyces cavernicola]|uniref:Oxygenase MpaB family protein n=1 Tax=Streptomyces cavernicola TaxID=3043613 RepID=A0ABT6S7Q8_9ACTN|nr:oxygenase MpaB family protein [Streptomyces sp. B-S-A6]MDI3404055.1 oxygenase MpaB family protein [Streptomyces sp. B-S-A6]
MGRYSRLRAIRGMDPQRDYEHIHKLVSQYEFPWDYTQGIGVAFIRDYAVPRISRLLDATGEFEHAGQKRYDDTILFAHEMVQDGFDSERGRAAARHLNRVHDRYNIRNEDFLYVLATTVVGPKRWIDRFGWRRLCAQEVESLALVGHKLAQLMNIEGAPSMYAEYERLLDAYERAHFAYDAANHRVARATFRTSAAWYPRWLRPLVTRFTLALLDEPLLRALGYAPQPRAVRRLAGWALRVRAHVVRLLPARPDHRPRLPEPRSYPFGYTLDDLGPAWTHTRPLRPLADEEQPTP